MKIFKLVLGIFTAVVAIAKAVFQIIDYFGKLQTA